MHLTTIQLNRQNNKPLYQQLITAIKKAVLNGDLTPGEKIPTIRNLAQALGVSRITVENAYSQLLDEGYLESQAKRGYYITGLGLPQKNSSEGAILYQPVVERAKWPEEIDQDRGGLGALDLPVTYDFSSFGVESSSFNMPVWRRYINNALKQPDLLTSYGPHQGEPRLLETLATYSAQARDVRCQPQQILVGAGTQSLLHILCGIFHHDNRVKTIGMQAPGFSQGEQIFRDHSFEVSPFSLSQLEKAQPDLPDLIWINPSNPYKGKGIAPSLRHKLLAAAAAAGSLLLEDDYIGEFRYLQRPLPSLQSLSQGENVIYLGSFSRTMLPAIRISFLVLPPSLLNTYGKIGHLYNQTASGMEQLALADFIGDGRLNRHIRKLRRLYNLKSQYLRQAIDQCFGTKITIAPYENGLRLLLLVPSSKSASELRDIALAKGVAITPLSSSLANKENPQKPWRQLMLSYAAIPEKDLVPGIQALSEAWQNCL